MYVPSEYDRTYVIPVWGRSTWLRDKVVTAHVTRRTHGEAIAFLVGLGYTIIDIGR